MLTSVAVPAASSLNMACFILGRVFILSPIAGWLFFGRETRWGRSEDTSGFSGLGGERKVLW